MNTQAQESKSFLKSRSVWGGIIAVLPALLVLIKAFTGFELTEEQTNALFELIAALSGLGGSMAVYGRIKAKKTLR